MSAPVVVIGAGPAGLTAAWELTKNGRSVVVLEADPHHVGGIARTAAFNGYRFDIGGHRFFTKSTEVQRLWREMLPEKEWRRGVPRLSRIYYRGRFFTYPLRVVDAFLKLGPLESLACGLSYVRARLIRVRRKPLSFEDWVTRQFGRRLFRIFFKTYTEKVWGMPCSEISADWAAQRIKGLSLGSALRSALPSWLAGARRHIKTLIDEFDYPRLGPGQLWESAASQIRGRGGHIHMGSRVTRISLAGRRVGAVGSTSGLDEVIGMDGAVISTMPIRDLIQVIDPPPPIAVSEAASALRYRDFLTVVIILDKSEVFPDNWIYIHEPEVRVGRIQNFRNWSPDMVADQATTSLGLEYFCHEGDTLWSSTDDALIKLATSELERIGLLGKANVVTGAVVRMPKAYPVYDATYKANVSLVREWLREHATNLQLVGRNGMHMYNNQDHSMLAAYLAARNLLGEEWDPWLVNADAEYHEETGATDSVGRFVPQRLIRP